MPKKRLVHTETFKTRHGKRMWYFRMGHGKRIRLPDDYGSHQFMEAYREALARATTRTKCAVKNQWLTSPVWEYSTIESACGILTCPKPEAP